ncbi:beta-trefoil DNA-binding domain-containing protein [Pilobolus umbonatus]|nr:beta-trefoil DNA-binding domain-containing protein [Pilobolus umbonatus]
MSFSVYETPMDSLLHAIDLVPDLKGNQMSIESLLDHKQEKKRRWHEEEDIRKKMRDGKRQIVCLHASVAQKSYGSEKRFLCPPPIVHIQSSTDQSDKLQLSMSVVCENGDKMLEQRAMLDENQSGSFKYLHVTGTAKAKQFNLKVDLLSHPHSSSSSVSSQSSCDSPLMELPIASFMSKPISIISKPSKKTAKTRNVSTCILANSPVSLFNRINSQTVRTKYMTTSNGRLCAKNTTWSPFNMIIVNQPTITPTTKSSKSVPRFNRIQLTQPPTPIHITYGTELILQDPATGISSPPLILRKVDKGRISPCAYGPVSQMQKVALQLASSHDLYLSAAGSLSESTIDTNTWLDYASSRFIRSPETVEEVDDYLCWTMVGISRFEYEYTDDDVFSSYFFDEPPSPHPSPLPVLTHIQYDPQSHTLNVVGQHLIQAAPVPRLLDIWVGTHGPLVTKISQPPQSHTPHEIHWSVKLPSTEVLANKQAEQSILLVRQDGLVYQTGKALLYHNQTWTVIHATA